MTRAPRTVFVFGNGRHITTMSESHANLLVMTARSFRIAKVKRSGRRGKRVYTLKPRKRSEWMMLGGTYGKNPLVK